MPKGSKNGMYSFDRFKLDAEKLMLYRDETEITLAPKIVKTLAVLIENRGSILSKDELIDKVWDDSIVEESNLSQNLYILRKTLGTKPDGGQYIETLRRRGYRFNAEVKIHSKNGSSVQKRILTSGVPLIGREKEVEEVATLLSRDDVRLVTVSGVGGVGKTSLTKAVAENLKGERDVFFIELAAITRPELVVSAIASAVGVKESGDGSLADRVKESLEGRPSLLILDNFEQVVTAAPVLGDLACSNDDGLKILVTSRIPLRLKAETMYVLPPLEIPEAVTGSVAAADLAGCEAVDLLVQRAKQAYPTFKLTAENAEAVASICTQLGGLPLAIELAAARLRFMSPEGVLKRLQNQLDILQGVKRDAPQRQQTMRETIAWSYDLLTDSEKQVFARLAVFSGGFDLAAAESICSDTDGDSSVSVLELITSLVEHNLLAVRTARNGEPRIHMLEVIREFAEEVLAESGEIEAARNAHAEYFLRLGDEAEPQLLAARSAGWLDRLETEHDNLRAALAWSAEHGPFIGQRLAGAIWRFWWLHGHIREACEQLDNFLAVSDGDPKVRAKLLVGATFLNRLAGNSKLSRVYAKEGVELASSSGDLRTGALSFNQLGFLALDVGDFTEAERMFSKGLKRAEELGDIQTLALLNNGYGELTRSKGDYKRAAEFYGRALEYNREAGDRVRQTTCLINLGATALMQNDRESAGEFYRSGLEISSEMEDMNGTLYCLEGLAGSYWALHDPERAAQLFGAANAGRKKNNLLLEPADQGPYEESVALVRDSVGADPFKANFSKGGEIGLTAAVSLALDKTSIRPDASRRVTNNAPKTPVSGEHVVVERHGNVLRIIDRRRSVEPEPIERIDVAKPTRPANLSRLGFIAIGLAIALIGTLAFVVFRGSNATSSANNFSEISVIKLTDGARPFGATIAPDGDLFAYTETDGTTERVFIQQVGQSNRLEIISSDKDDYQFLTFSNDGRFVYTVVADKKGESRWLIRIPSIGGPPVRVADKVHSPVTFSPDGKEMAFTRVAKDLTEWSIVIADTDGKTERILFSRRSPSSLGIPAWSPDGNSIAVGGTMLQPTSKAISGRILLVSVTNGDVRELSSEDWGTFYRLAWTTDGKGLVMIATRANETLSTRRDNVYFISYPEGRSHRVSTDGSRYDPSSLGITKSGGILAVPSNRLSQIWAMSANGDEKTAYQVTRGSADGRAGLNVLSDGRIVYINRTGDDLRMWVAKSEGSDAKQVANEFGALEESRADPSGKHLVFSAMINGGSHLFRSDLDGNNIRQLTFGSDQEVDSDISPDGSTIVYATATRVAGYYQHRLMTMPSEGGEPRQLVDFECSRPLFAPDGKKLSCVTAKEEAVIISTDGREIERFKFPLAPSTTSNYGIGWLPGSNALGVIINENGYSNIWSYPLTKGKPTRLTNFTSGIIYRYAFSPDGTRLYLARGYPTHDAILITNHGQN